MMRKMTHNISEYPMNHCNHCDTAHKIQNGNGKKTSIWIENQSHPCSPRWFSLFCIFCRCFFILKENEKTKSYDKINEQFQHQIYALSTYIYCSEMQWTLSCSGRLFVYVLRARFISEASRLFYSFQSSLYFVFFDPVYYKIREKSRTKKIHLKLLLRIQRVKLFSYLHMKKRAPYGCLYVYLFDWP